MRRAFLNRQSGAVLLLILLFLTISGFFWLAAAAQSPRRESVSSERLAMAKEALLGYAVAYPELDLKGERKGKAPGFLPCPYTSASLYEGIEAGSCGARNVSALGHLPWRSLGLPPLRDSEGECFWYLVSGNHKGNFKADLLNFDTPGLIEVLAPDGQTVVAKDVVAVLFASGKPLPGQIRRYLKYKDGKEGECRADFDASQYLDSVAGITNHTPNPAAEGITRVALGDNEHINDRLVWITRDEWRARMEARLPPEAFFGEDDWENSPALTQRTAACLARFGNANTLKRLPWAAPLELKSTPPKTFQLNNFADQKDRLGGRPPYSIEKSRIAIDVKHFDCAFLDVCLKPKTGDTDPEPEPPPPNDYLFIQKKCPEFKMDIQNGLWDEWKDHLFYLVAPNYAPAGTPADTPAESCETAPDGCLRVAGKPYAAAVIFAGESLPGQKRENSGRMDAAQYLEGENAVSVRYGGRTLSVSGNDQISCIADDAGRGTDKNRFRLVANCGRNDCRAYASAWLACQEHKTGKPSDAPCAAPESFAGCPCLGTASHWQEENCDFASPRPVCRRLLARMKSCA